MVTQNTSTASLKLLAQVAFEKAHYATVYRALIRKIIKIVSKKAQKHPDQMAQLFECLIQAQSQINRYGLSPSDYEAGFDQIREISKKQVRHFQAVETLNTIQAHFRQRLKAQSDFTANCFRGDLQDLLKKAMARTMSLRRFTQKITYYAALMEPYHYYQQLVAFKKALETHGLDYRYQTKVQALIADVDPLATIRSYLNIQNNGSKAHATEATDAFPNEYNDHAVEPQTWCSIEGGWFESTERAQISHADADLIAQPQLIDTEPGSSPDHRELVFSRFVASNKLCTHTQKSPHFKIDAKRSIPRIKNL